MDLQCLFLNCTLKKSPSASNTQALIDKVAGIFASIGVACETVRVVDYDVKFGTNSDEGDGDEWPRILAKCLAADILVMASPVWIGERSSVAKMAAERLDATTYGTDEFGRTRCTTRSAGHSPRARRTAPKGRSRRCFIASRSRA